MRLGLAVGLAVIVALAALPSPAGSHLTRHSDGDDPGRLDIREMAFNHGPKRLFVTVRTDGRWRSRFLTGRRYVSVYMKPTSRRGRGYFVTAKYRRGKLRGIVQKVRRDYSRKRVGRAGVGRPNRHTVRFRVQRGVIRAGRAGLRWNVQTYSGRHADVAPAYDSTYFHDI